jgi:hypothetical protein
MRTAGWLPGWVELQVLTISFRGKLERSVQGHWAHPGHCEGTGRGERCRNRGCPLRASYQG